MGGERVQHESQRGLKGVNVYWDLDKKDTLGRIKTWFYKRQANKHRRQDDRQEIERGRG